MNREDIWKYYFKRTFYLSLSYWINIYLSSSILITYLCLCLYTTVERAKVLLIDVNGSMHVIHRKWRVLIEHRTCANEHMMIYPLLQSFYTRYMFLSIYIYEWFIAYFFTILGFRCCFYSKQSQCNILLLITEHIPSGNCLHNGMNWTFTLDWKHRSFVPIIL